MKLLSILFLFTSFQQTDSTFFSVENIKPYIHFSDHHGKLYFVQGKEEGLQFKSLDIEHRVQSIWTIIDDNEANLHNYHISVGNDLVMIKKESQLRQEYNQLDFFSLDGLSNEYILQSPKVSSGLYHLVNDSTLYIVERTDSLSMAHILKIDDHQTIERKHALFSYPDFPEWKKTIDNSLLKYKMKAVSDAEGNTCSVFLYTSWLLCSKNDGTELFATDQPDEINFPDVAPVIRGEAQLRSSPDAEDHQVQNIDIAMDEHHIYVLVFGERIRRMALLRAALSGQRIDLDEFTTTSDRVYLYDKFSGDFLKEISLPNKVRAITVNKEYLVVAEDGENPGIRWIHKSEYDL